MSNHVYQIVEVNVDGCGEDVYEYVSFPHQLSQVEEKLFSQILNDVKKKTASKDFDTASMISEALNQFAKKANIGGKLFGDPCEGRFVF